MKPPEQMKYARERAETYDRILALIQRHIDDKPVVLMESASLLSIGTSRAAAERESWTLFRDGIKHLKDGGPAGRPGMFSTAVTKASLRSSSAAKGLNIKVPEFAEQYFDANHASGELEAVFYALRLAEAGLGDAERSGKVFERHLAKGAPPLHTTEDPVKDRDLAKVFSWVRKPGAPEPKDAATQALEAAIRDQAILTMKLQADCYKTVGAVLKQDIRTLATTPPPAPPAKPVPAP